MKKEKLIIVIAIITLCLILICALFAMSSNNNSIEVSNNNSSHKSDKDIESKLDIVKSISNRTVYFPFEKNGKSYILFGYLISSYSDPEKSTMTINNLRYENDSLIITLYINEESKHYNVPEGTIVDDYSINILWDILETNSKYSKVYLEATRKNINGVDDREVQKFDGGVVKKNNKCGYVDEDANLTIPYIYDGIYELDVNGRDLKDSTGKKLNLDYSNYIRINDENGNGIATKQGEVLIKCQYGNIGYYGENTFFVTKGNGLSDWQTGVVDINDNIIIDFINGNIVRPSEYFTSSQFAEYAVYDEKHGYHGIIDRDFNIIIQPIYSEVSMHVLNNKEFDKTAYYFVVGKDDKRAVLDYSGQVKIDFCDKSIYELWNEYERMIRNGNNN